MRILMVEDEIKLARATKRALELQQYAVDVAGDGEVGLDLAVGERYDLVILDLMLPKVNGMEICRQMRQEGVQTPVLMLTAKGQVADRVAGLDAGADDYLIKPFSFEELVARIRALARRAANSGEPVLTAGDLSLDPETIKVARAGKPVELSAKEYAILEYLLRHKNTVVSREQIIQSVWSYDTEVLPGTVEVHIKNLRDKVDAPFGKQLIKTVRGFGYEIREE